MVQLITKRNKFWYAQRIAKLFQDFNSVQFDLIEGGTNFK